ncbi:MAG: hypothetical protein ABS68_08405 [Niastella sp. SCN 39-18]|nr:response regulator [Sphingobacteriales bacterium]ODT52587.1 MAG: hypothetical protein ABS68_08405 [Niastella sp. SCN 39-18]OJW11726.1 MAG: hypothetical protein BGO53_12470 [Sphingobacteriales bacterium 39-19]
MIFSFGKGMQPKKILIIDDEADFGILLKKYFEQRNCIVVVANTLEEGLALLPDCRPDYIFLDNNLPDGRGWGKVDYILANYPEAQLNLVSGHFVPKTTAQNFKIIEKPLSIEELDFIFKNDTLPLKPYGYTDMNAE